MNIAEKIYKEASKLPVHLAKEVLDYLEYIEQKYASHDGEIQNLQEAQTKVMNHIWENEEDCIWDEC